MSIIKSVPFFYNLPGVTVKVKSANQAINNSAVFADVTEMVIPVAASVTVVIDAVIRATFAAASANNLLLKFTIPAAGSIAAFNFGSSNATEYDPSLDEGNFAFTPSVLSRQQQYRYLYVGGANSGNIQLQMRQSVAEAKDYTFRSGSFLIARRLA